MATYFEKVICKKCNEETQVGKLSKGKPKKMDDDAEIKLLFCPSCLYMLGQEVKKDGCVVINIFPGTVVQ